MNFSIIICTFNPDQRILERVLNSCIQQSISASQYEIILVDNNSLPALNTRSYISALIEGNKIKYNIEQNQGLVHARLKGIKLASAPTVVFVDDDNILSPDYLENISLVLNSQPNAGAFGPGKIKVDFVDGAPTWIKKEFSSLYQEKDLADETFGNAIEWKPYYPAGSGLVVKKEILDEYAVNFEKGLISATGRKGSSLASAEDSQIIWTAIKLGFLAGTSPKLQLIHVIPKSRTTLPYLKKLNYGISYSYYNALKEMFPQYELPLKKRTLFNKTAFLLRTLVRAGFNPIKFYRHYAINNSWLKGFDDYMKGPGNI